MAFGSSGNDFNRMPLAHERRDQVSPYKPSTSNETNFQCVILFLIRSSLSLYKKDKQSAQYAYSHYINSRKVV